jgi:hypothetical protein
VIGNALLVPAPPVAADGEFGFGALAGPVVVVYGATPGGILAAVTAARAGRRVVILEPTQHVGGMLSSGLGWTDTGDRATIGGYTREFFDRMEAAAGEPEGRYHFEPSVAEAVFEAMLGHPRITLHRGERLVQAGAVTVSQQRIIRIRMESGRSFAGHVFIDASYEGDLLARAGVTYEIGRESTMQQSEAAAGVRPAIVVATLPSGRDPGFPTAVPGAVGTADTRIQAANYRICFSSDPANQVPFALPAGYDPNRFEVILDHIHARTAADQTATPTLAWFLSISPLVNNKHDVNDFGALSTAIPGLNWDYPDATYEDRAALDAQHRSYDQGLIWFLANDPRIPVPIRTQMAAYGLCADEFVDNGNWPWLLYQREARRMVGAYVLRQRDIDHWRYKDDSIGIASYRRDSHFVSRWIDAQGRLLAEGPLPAHARVRWDIPYRSLTPRTGEMSNLLVPVAASATHVAHSSLRMEPQYMIMGEATGQAAAMAAGQRQPTVQSIDVDDLQDRLRAHGAFIPDRAR